MICLVLSVAPISETRADDESNTEYVKVDGLYWGIDRSKGEITWFPREWDGTDFPTSLDGMEVKSIGGVLLPVSSADKGARAART